MMDSGQMVARRSRSDGCVDALNSTPFGFWYPVLLLIWSKQYQALVDVS